MDKRLNIGILRETKNPPDRRVPLTPSQISALEKSYPIVKFFVQPANLRCFSNEEFEQLNIPLAEDLTHCDILMGVKEVDKQTFIPGKVYMFFSHVGKKQPHNRLMLTAMSEKKISLIDYEYLTTEKGQRVVAFGRYAGIVGAYNGLRAIGIRSGSFNLKPANQCHDLDELWRGLRLIEIKSRLKILITGEGRVACGAMETLNTANIVRVKPDQFLSTDFDVPVYCQIGPGDYTRNKNGQNFSFTHFATNPQEYVSTFLPYTRVTDFLITGHYWDPRSPCFFTKEDMKQPEFRISVIADISCDINGPIPSTVRPTVISDPFYDYNPHLETEQPPFLKPDNITVMSIDNLPGELPRNASHDFGMQLMQNVLDDIFTGNESNMISRATIISEGVLTGYFAYLKSYLEGKS